MPVQEVFVSNINCENSLRNTVVIIGAGVCGLSIGWQLAEAGAKVTILEKSEPGRGATWAAAGMLAARAEAEPGEQALLSLNLKSQEYWPEFRNRLEKATGVPIGYRDEGTIIVALDRDDAADLEFNYKLQAGLSLDTKWLSGSEAREREPFLSPKINSAIFSPLDHQVDNRDLVNALRIAFVRAGGDLKIYSEVDSIVTENGSVRGVHSNGEEIPARFVVLAAGAWSRTIRGIAKADLPPIRPLKGQMLALRMDPNKPLLRHVLWAPKGIYMVPRNDGRLLIGATVEEKDFDAELTAGGILHLLRESWEALPGIDELEIDEMWTGHRPTSRDDAPILGPTSVEGLIIATGHHRNGILLAPITAKTISQLILTGDLPKEIKPFGIERFRKPKNRTPHAA